MTTNESFGSIRQGGQKSALDVQNAKKKHTKKTQLIKPYQAKALES